MMNLENITLTYPDGDGRVTAVDNVSLELPVGDITVLTGPSGSGKSSLLAVAATLIRPDSGRVLIDGVDVSGLGRRDADRLRRESIGIVFQQSNLIASLTAREQLIALTELAGTRAEKRAARERADELLEAVGLASKAELRPHQLSGGQRQRVNIARALMGQPSVLLVDEPTSALDQENGAAILALIDDLTRRSGASTLLVTHNLSLWDADTSIVTMVDGAIVSVEAVDTRVTGREIASAA